MTKQKDFKVRVRARMNKTGESYTTARAKLLRASDGGQFPGYPGWGGDDIDVAVTQHALANMKHQPLGEPLSEAMLFGLSGGIGFAYFTFEYKGSLPTMTVMMRKNTLPGALMGPMLERAGVVHHTHQTASPKKAETQLLAALETGHAALCTIGSGALAYTGRAPDAGASAPQQVAVVSIDGDRAWLDDRPRLPVEVPLQELTRARGVYRKAKHRTIALEGSVPDHPLQTAIVEAIRETTSGFHEAPYANFAANFGLRGMHSLADALDGTAPKKKRWSQLFGLGAARARGCLRLEECIERDYTAPSGGRPLYAAFLEQSAALLGRDELLDIAEGFRRSGKQWSDLATAALASNDTSFIDVQRTDREYRELLRRSGHRAAPRLAQLRAQYEQQLATVECPEAPEHYPQLAQRLRELEALERRLIERLASVAGA
ncbi:MAG: DUF4872 domain-containing protein [Myxococcales bacterium]|nr:DUF4872 domain-containing protein [Myxococcales bacterium]